VSIFRVVMLVNVTKDIEMKTILDIALISMNVLNLLRYVIKTASILKVKKQQLRIAVVIEKYLKIA
jgi:uncharacterized membrane protein